MSRWTASHRTGMCAAIHGGRERRLEQLPVGNDMLCGPCTLWRVALKARAIRVAPGKPGTEDLASACPGLW